MEKGFAYTDKYGIVHVAPTLEIAEDSSKSGVVIEFYGDHRGGYPILENRAVIIYTQDNKIKHAGREYFDGEWPIGAKNIKEALKELL